MTDLHFSSADNYFIKSGYKANPVLSTPDHVSGISYWNSSRIQASFYYQYHVYDYAISLMKERNLSRVIDVGCGIAVKLQHLKKRIPNADIIGIDQPDPIAYCQQTYDFGTWLVDDFENAKINAENITPPDLIICADVIEHVANPDHILSYIRNLAGKDTLILISTPERDRMRGKDCMSCPHPQHVREWNAEEFRQYVESRDFKVIDQKCVPPYKRNLRPSFIRYEIKRLKQGLPLLNNQLVLLSAN